MIAATTLYKFLLCCICSIMVCTANAQSTTEEKNMEPPAIAIEEEVEEVTTYEEPSKKLTTSYDKRAYDEKRINELKAQKEFQYDEVPAKLQTGTGNYYEYETQSGNAKNEESFTEQQQQKKGTKESNTNTKKYEEAKPGEININWLVVILLGVAIILLILYFSGFKLDSLQRRNKLNGNEDKPLEEEHIDNIKFESELEKAIRLKNYKLAVRILYLETLKKMNDTGTIDWKINKTNWDYVREVQAKSWQPDFKRITNAFDYVWYGNFAIDASTFTLMHEQINAFKQKI